MADSRRLIDGNALNWRASQEKMTELFPNWKELPQEVKDMLCKHGKEFERLLKEAPTVDAVEVVHGRWDIQRYYGGVRKGMIARVICSECGYPNEKTNYCPNCGAKMDGGNEDG